MGCGSTKADQMKRRSELESNVFLIKKDEEEESNEDEIIGENDENDENNEDDEDEEDKEEEDENEEEELEEGDEALPTKKGKNNLQQNKLSKKGTKKKCNNK